MTSNPSCQCAPPSYWQHNHLPISSLGTARSFQFELAAADRQMECNL